MADVVVVGGGPAGCAYAVTAARLGRDVVLVDDGRRNRTWAGESLPAGGGELMASVFGPRVLDESVHARAFGTAAAWGSNELVAHDYMGHWSGGGWHLDRAAFDAALRDVAADVGVTVIRERVITVADADGEWLVNDRHACATIVDASGRAGAVASRLGVGRIKEDEQVAVIAVVTDRGGERVTTVESAPQGWWYTTPLPGDQRVVALVTDADLVASPEHRATWWASALRSTVHVSVIAGEADGEVSVYPADTTYRERLHGDGWLAVGDAAVSFDPLSSQGLITGVVMAARAAALGDLEAWEADYRMVLEEHLRERRSLVEHRWPGSVFWQRRTG